MAFSNPAFEKHRQQVLGGKAPTISSPSGVAKSGGVISNSSFEAQRQSIIKQGPKVVSNTPAPVASKPVVQQNVFQKAQTAVSNIVKSVAGFSIKLVNPSQPIVSPIPKDPNSPLAKQTVPIKVSKPITIKPNQTKLTSEQIKQVGSPFGPPIPNTKLSQGKKPTVWQKITDRIGELFDSEMSQKARAMNAGAVLQGKSGQKLYDTRINQIAKARGITPKQADEAVLREAVKKNVSKFNIVGLSMTKLSEKGSNPLKNSLMEDVSKELGIRTDATTSELGQGIFTVAIGLGLATATVPTLVGLGLFEAVNKVKSGVISAIKGKGFDIDSGMTLSDVFENAPADVKNLIDVVDFLATAKISHKIYKTSPTAFEKLTKDTIETYNMPSVINLDAQAVRKVNLGKGGKYETDLVSSLGLSSSQWRKAVKEGLTVQVQSEKLVRIVDKPYWAKIKALIGKEPTNIETKSQAGAKATGGFAGYLPSGEATPAQVTGAVFKAGIEKTADGKEILKAALEAQQNGQNMVIEPEVKTAKPAPIVKTETPKEIAMTNETISGIEKAKQYASAKDFADAEHSAKPTDKIGLVDSAEITPRDPVDKTGATYMTTIEQIEQGKINEIPPIEISKEGEKIVTTDGSNRLQAAIDKGVKIPAISRSDVTLDGMSTFQELYDNISKLVEKQKPKRQSAVDKQLQAMEETQKRRLEKEKALPRFKEAEFSEKDLVVKEGDYVIGRDGLLAQVTSGNDTMPSDGVGYEDPTMIRTKTVGGEPNMNEGKDVGFIEYANQIRKATPEEIAKVKDAMKPSPPLSPTKKPAPSQPQKPAEKPVGEGSKTSVVPTEKGVPQAVTKHLQDKYERSFEKATKTQISEALSETKTFLRDTDYSLLKKLSNASAGVSIDAQVRPALLYGGVGKGVFTDGFILINNKRVAEETSKRLIDLEIAKEAKEIMREDSKKTLTEAKNIAEKNATQKIKENEDKYPQYQRILDLVAEKKGSELSLQGYQSNYMGTFAVFTDGKNQIVINANMIALMQKYFPDAKLFTPEPNRPVGVWQGDSIEAVVMPIRFDGNTILIDAKGKKIVTEEEKAPSGFASGGKEPRDFSGKKVGVIQGIEMPEMVRIAKELTGITPQVKEYMGKALGRFYPDQEGKIALQRDIFKDPSVAAQVLAHEIGHLIDWLPDKYLKRGNLFGRLASLRNFLRHTFTNPEVEKLIDPLYSERKDLLSQRASLKNPEKNAFVADKRKALTDRINDLNSQIEKMQEDAFKLPQVKDELIKLSEDWNNTDLSKGGNYNTYKKKPSELYADAVSVLFNDPAYLKEKTPTFWKLFFKHLDEKPTVKNNLFETWDLLHQGDEAVFKARDAELSKSFDTAEKAFADKYLDQQKRTTSLMYHIKLLFDDKNTPIRTKINQLRKEGKELPPELNPDIALKGLLYSEGELKNYINDHFQPVFAKAQETPGGWEELGKMVFYERVIHERGEFANPQGYNPKTAQDQLDTMKKNDPQAFAKLSEAKDLFRKAVQQSVELAEKEGYYTPEMIKTMKTNPAYATFQVVEYLDTYITPRVYQQKGTLKDIANPATSTVMKLINLHKAIKRNSAKKLNMDFLKEHFAGDIEVARTKFNGKSMDITPPKDPDKGLVITIENGKPQGYYVEKDIENMLNYNSNQTLEAAARVSRAMSQSRFYRPLFTVYNLGFQSFNFVRDLRRTWRNYPHKSLAEIPLSPLFDAYKVGSGYVKAIIPSYKRALNKPNNLIKEMENANILGFTYNDIYAGDIDPEAKQIERIFESVGILDKKKKMSVMRPFTWALDTIGTVGDFIETLPKVAGYVQLKGKMNETAMADYIRTSIGSPAFRVGGTFTPVSNNIFLFSNAIKEGIKSDFQVSTGKKGKATGAGFWYKTVLGDFLPKFLMAAVAAGYFGQKLKDQMDQASEYDKTNYTVIPLGTDKNGKAILFRLPHDETGRFLGGLLWKAINMNKDGVTPQDVFDVFSFGAGQFPNLSPSFTGAGAVVQYLAGQNPYDDFRGRNVIPDTEFKAGPKYSAPLFLEWLAKNQGLGMFFPSYSPDNPTDLEKLLTAPFLANILGRWVKVSDYGYVEQLKLTTKGMEEQSAQKTLETRKAVDEAITAYGQKPTPENKTAWEVKLVKDMLGSNPDKTQKTNLVKKFRIGIIRGQGDPQMNSLIDADTNAQKVELLRAIDKKMDDSEFTKFMETAKKYKIISSDVIKSFRKQQ